LLRKEKFYKFLQQLTLDFLNLLHEENLISEEKVRITLLNPRKRKAYEVKSLKWLDFNSEFNRFMIQFKKQKICLQIISTLKLSDPKNDNNLIPVNFEIFLNCDNSLISDLGHWSFDLSGESDDFPLANSKWDFNDFFSIKYNNVGNISHLKKMIQFFEFRTYPKKNIRKINIGEDVMPWERIHNALYVYRENFNLFQGDLIKSFDTIREEIMDPSLLIDDNEREILTATWKKGFISKIKNPDLLEQINYLNKTHHFIPEYFEEENVGHAGSFRLYDEEGFIPLYPVIEKFYSQLNETMDEVTSWKDIWDEFIKVWGEKHPTIKDKKMQSN